MIWGRGGGHFTGGKSTRIPREMGNRCRNYRMYLAVVLQQPNVSFNGYLSAIQCRKRVCRNSSRVLCGTQWALLICSLGCDTMMQRMYFYMRTATARQVYCSRACKAREAGLRSAEAGAVGKLAGISAARDVDIDLLRMVLRLLIARARALGLCPPDNNVGCGGGGGGGSDSAEKGEQDNREEGGVAGEVRAHRGGFVFCSSFVCGFRLCFETQFR